MALLKSFHQSGLEEGKNFVDWRERGGRKPFPPILASSFSYFPPIPASSSLFFLFLSPTLTSNSLPRRTGIVASIVAAKEATCDQRILVLFCQQEDNAKSYFHKLNKITALCPTIISFCRLPSLSSRLARSKKSIGVGAIVTSIAEQKISLQQKHVCSKSSKFALGATAEN